MIMNNHIKLIGCFILVTLLQSNLVAQVPRPYWAKNVIQAPESGKYIFVYGEGNGKTEDEARNKAFADAVVKGQYELGSVNIGAQDIAKIEKGGLDAAMRFTNRQIKITCQTDPLIVENERNDIQYRTFVLIQMSINADRSAKFYDLPHNWSCDDANYYHEVAAYNDRMKSVKKAKEKDQEKAQRRADRKYRRQNRLESFGDLWMDDYEHGKYISLAVGNGITYGGANLIGFALSGRIGGTMGIEPHAGLGFSKKRINAISGKDSTSKTFNKLKLVYSFGLNVFLYKGFYLGINYGCNEFVVTDHFYDDYESRYTAYQSDDWWSNKTYEEYVYYHIYSCTEVQEEQERFSLSSINGLSFVLGYKIYLELCTIDIGAGCKCYGETDTAIGFDKIGFTWNIGIGIGN